MFELKDREWATPIIRKGRERPHQNQRVTGRQTKKYFIIVWRQTCWHDS